MEIGKLCRPRMIYIKEIVMYETWKSCIYEYSSWFHYDQVRLIDNVYVIKVLF